LVGRREALELTLGVSRIHALFQYGAREPCAFHLDELVDQDIAGRSQIAFEAESAAQQIRLTVSTPVSEMGEVQFNAPDPVDPVFHLGQQKPLPLSAAAKLHPTAAVSRVSTAL